MSATPHNVTTAFDEIVAAFNDQPRCEMTTLAGGQCQRPARWRVDLHGCEQAIMCSHHKTAWIRHVLAEQLDGQPRCAHCRTVFDRFDDAVRITAI